MTPTFSIIVVSYNAGEKLHKTMASIMAQTFRDFEIIVKDGGSTDGSLSDMAQHYADILNAPIYPCLTIMTGKDRGIYDAMNIATLGKLGRYVIFMNCGDTFYDERVLEKTAVVVDHDTPTSPMVYYGDVYRETNRAVDPAPPEITGFTCYRNIPCHQACFYDSRLIKAKPFNLDYKIRADYDQFLWCFYKGRAGFRHLGFTVASYEGGGYSETEENRQRDKDEHDVITREYMSPNELSKYKLTMALTMAPMRRAISENPRFSGIYQGIKRKIYMGK